MPKLPERFRLRVDEYLPDALTAVSAGVFSVASIGPAYDWSGKVIVALVIAGVLCAGGAIIYNRRRHRPTLLKLTSENKSLKGEVAQCKQQIDDRATNLVNVVNILLRDLANDIGIYKGDTRLSVYRHSEGEFYLVGRVSPNETYAAVGRISYPDTQGFIGQVWRAADDKTTVSFPAGRQDWIDTQVKSFGFSQAEADALIMHTVVMTATKLRRDLHGDAFGVLCIECDRKRSTIQAGTINAVKESLHFQTLTSILDISLTGLTHEEVKRGFLERASS
ncbi:hypothetical protein ACRDU6_27460 [Mycolicibacterium sp. ELW1]|uniref:hypothetical protein n=1 Tax=Mycobacteriaceae TaxID=1762 RepID=UPI0011EFB47F|nr:hypothetical protein [Mycobacterium sp. ELW1]QEN15932.1 hypothetical protein D3H54_23975 [Mycobacterium sp. ELW1]